MRSEKQTAVSHPATPEHRRSSRFPVVVPVEVAWQGPGGTPQKEPAQAKEVNIYGGLLYLRTYPALGTEIEVTNLISNETIPARVVAVRRSKQDAALGVAIEFRTPNKGFWGVAYRLKDTSAELLHLEQAIRTGGIDARLLREFRDAVDHIRKTAWAVQEWQERQALHRDAHTVLPLLTAERIRRATQLSHNLGDDLDTHEVTKETAGITELFQALKSVQRRLAELLGEDDR